ncbi:SgcJ/EcaC family oxidoreductase [Trinickia caryophylli]|uniref:DUF4440 domain-containing protein n=1 Tax=Trinickia caryophylli TaxID=28094 RepID=A0A1X7D0R3_TRICW|nr:SgcJ/EcaC family oxidoreductase [Trinickia caryophylli]PMS13630.1 DUF4440 domain-containing protein [Trinickia caryophylli]TRX13611.1 SgcJ/EcaC family oxidoreductase [Trinickia caryophylli]WQE15189.1 SgcJ/EcaC family oxidoreductase [Trinickia caryophylli]SMF06078.1 conserved hypothetical protein [Trinickia caryophylli]GLU31071.1 ketosteroid isomerase [Trinickia caryophylli]
MTEDEHAIRALVDTWMSASKAGDTQTLLGLMTDDMVFMTPDREPFGKQAFAAASQAQQGMRIEGTAEILELRVVGDWAFMRNRIDIRVWPPGTAEPIRHAGYTLTLAHKNAAGQWQLARDANLVGPKP